MDLPPIGKKEGFGDNIHKTFTEDWIFSTPLEKVILTFLMIYFVVTFLKWLFGGLI